MFLGGFICTIQMKNHQIHDFVPIKSGKKLFLTFVYALIVFVSSFLVCDIGYYGSAGTCQPCGDDETTVSEGSLDESACGEFVHIRERKRITASIRLFYILIVFVVFFKWSTMLGCKGCLFRKDRDRESVC